MSKNKPAVPRSLLEAFRMLPDFMADEPTRWSWKERLAACRLAGATSGLKNLKITNTLERREFGRNDASGSLDRVWCEIGEKWANRSSGEINVQDWIDLLVEVLLESFAYPDRPAFRSYQAGLARSVYGSVAHAARDLNDLLAYVPEEQEPGYCEGVARFIEAGLCFTLSDLADACEQVKIDDGIMPDLRNTRTNHTDFFQTIACNLRHFQYRHGEPLPLSDHHLVAFAEILIPESIAGCDPQSLERQARGELNKHGPGADSFEKSGTPSS